MENGTKRNMSGVQKLILSIFIVIGIGLGLLIGFSQLIFGIGTGIIIIFLGVTFAASIRVADQWEKGVVLRLGKFKALAGPGIFFVVPLIDKVPIWIDQRIITTKFTAEQTLTKDTVPVNVDAVLFWMVWDAEKAALEVADYNDAVSWAAQTALRDLIGKTMLEDMLSTRSTIDNELKVLMDERTEPWGITIQSVQIRDIRIPSSLQDAMSRAAQAERERIARTILGEAERQVAESFVEAAEMYNHNPTAFQLRALNILYEGLKEKASMIVVPSALADVANLGNILGLASAEKLVGQHISSATAQEK